MADFNYKVIKGVLMMPAVINEQGATFKITYRQGNENIEICCFIPARNTYLLNVAKEYFVAENKGKKIVLVGSDSYNHNIVILVVSKIHFIDVFSSLSKIRNEHIDFSDD